MKIIVAGDFCPRFRVESYFNTGNYSAVLSEAKTVIEKFDYSIVNFECPIVKEEAVPIEKQGPNLKSNLNGLKAVKYADFDCVTLANNHFYDFGETGVSDTLSALDELNIDFCGGGKDIFQASKVLYKEINGERIAIINCCEHEFSIATEKQGGSNPINPIQQFYDIQEAKKNADYILVIVHGGHEFYQLPSIRMQETYRFFIDSGADAVINHHQHCFSGYEIYNGKTIFYGLGNFLFDISPVKINDTWNYGYMVGLTFSTQGISSEIIPYEQCGEKAEVKLLPQGSFDEKLNELNAIISDKKALKKETEEYYRQTCFDIGHSVLEPIKNHYYFSALKKKLVPSLISKKLKLRAENFICCESHRDKLIYFFNKSLK